MPAAGPEDAQGAEDADTRRPAGSAVHRTAVGDRYSEYDPRNRRQGRDHRAHRHAHRSLDTENESPDRKTLTLPCDSSNDFDFLLFSYRIMFCIVREIFPSQTCEDCAAARTTRKHTFSSKLPPSVRHKLGHEVL